MSRRAPGDLLYRCDAGEPVCPRASRIGYHVPNFVRRSIDDANAGVGGERRARASWFAVCVDEPGEVRQDVYHGDLMVGRSALENKYIYPCLSMHTKRV